MNARRTLLTGVVVLALGGTIDLATAQESSSSAEIVRGGAGGIAYQSGGIGPGQAAEMARHLKRYDLQLTLTEGNRNAYATGVRVIVTDAAGRSVLAIDDAGPLIDIDLPAGHYRVVADFGRIKRFGSVDVEKGALATLYLHAPMNHG